MAQQTIAGVSPAMQECIDQCLRCYATCDATVTHCLEMGGKHVERAHLTLMLDCAQLCQTSAQFMLHGSAFHSRTCGLCAEVCRACAESCEAVDPRDDVMRQCADECRRCADSCARMASG